MFWYVICCPSTNTWHFLKRILKQEKNRRAHVIIPRRWQAITKSRLLRRITYKFDFKLL
uniref:Uncharacterized protein n=1 Tax=Anguilla anguilla TaxID=7936 RepID=A0A0E9QNQ3_ANGAN